VLGEIPDDRLDALAAAGDKDVADAVRKARPGELTNAVKSRMGWHVFRCEAYQPPSPIPLAEVSQAIGAELTRRGGDDAVRRRIAELRPRARVSIDEQALQRATAKPN
jgi:hypothetical protein